MRYPFKTYLPTLLVMPSLLFGVSVALFPPFASAIGWAVQMDDSVGKTIISVVLLVISWISFLITNGHKSHLITVLSFSVVILVIYCNIYIGIITSVFTLIILFFEKNKALKVVAVIVLIFIVFGLLVLVFIGNAINNEEQTAVIKNKIESPTGTYLLVEKQYKHGNSYELRFNIEYNHLFKTLFFEVRQEDKTFLEYWTTDPSDLNKTISWASDTEVIVDGEIFDIMAEKKQVRYSSNFIITDSSPN